MRMNMILSEEEDSMTVDQDHPMPTKKQRTNTTCTPVLLAGDGNKKAVARIGPGLQSACERLEYAASSGSRSPQDEHSYDGRTVANTAVSYSFS